MEQKQLRLVGGAEPEVGNCLGIFWALRLKGSKAMRSGLELPANFSSFFHMLSADL